MIGVNVDITEREDAERALRESEEHFRLAVEAAPSGMIMTDPQGRIVLVNRLAEALFGYDRQELIGRSVEVLGATEVAQRQPTVFDVQLAVAADESAEPARL